ncbi:MAG: TolC family protein, partial [Bacteroidota bacterium]
PARHRGAGGLRSRYCDAGTSRMQGQSRQAGWQEAKQILEFRRDEQQYAQESFRIINKKYRQDQAILVELQEARTDFTTAQLSESIARYDLKIKEAALEAAINLP